MTNLNILWDFDGTIFNTYPAYTKIFKKVLNNDSITYEEAYKNLKISISYACDYYRLSDTQIREYKSMVENISPQEMKPFDHVEDVLKTANKNVIMTHKDRESVHKILAYYGWETYFTDMVAGDDGFPRKPDKSSYEYLHKDHELDLAIGDRELDIIPANEIGIATCLFQNENSQLADYYLDDYKAFWETVRL